MIDSPSTTHSTRNTKSTLAQFLGQIAYLLGPHRMRVVLAIAAMTVGLALRLYSPLLMQDIVDQVFVRKDTSGLQLLPLLILFSFAPFPFFTLANYLTAWIGQSAAAEVRSRTLENLLRQGMRFFDDGKAGELVNEIIAESSGAILSITGPHLQDLLRSIPTIALAFVAMYSINGPLAVVCILIFPVFFLPIRVFIRLGERYGEQFLDSRRAAANLVQEAISGVRLVMTMNRQSQVIERLRAHNNRLVGLWAKTVMLDSLNELWFLHIMQAIGTVTVFVFGAYLSLNGQLSIGGLIAFLAYIPMLYSAISTLPSYSVDWARNKAALERAFVYMDMKSDIIERPKALNPTSVKGQLEFDGVSFGYASREQMALHNISLCIKPGEFVALVGPSGSGKSTIADLLQRFYDVTSGHIRIDGVDIRDLMLASLRRQIAVVPQDTFLFNDEIRANLLFGNEAACEEQLVTATKAAQIHDFISTLPESYHTKVGERGVKLSGGEKQRISIARALLKNSSILVLDEATSFLDSVTESAVRKALRPLIGKVTIVAIAHRLSTVIDADCIYVFRQGCIVEQGTHQELLSKDGFYAELFNAQLNS